MYCHKCGHELVDDALFCNKCGTRQAPTSRSSEFPYSDKTTVQLAENQLFPPPHVENIATTPIPQNTSLAWQTPLVAQPITPMPSLVPFNTIQRWMIQLFQPTLASNPFFMVTFGAFIAVVTGVLFITLFLTIAHALAARTLGNEAAIDYIIGTLPLGSLFRESLFLFFTALGPVTHTQYSSTQYAYNDVLNGLLLLPALGLILGGYIAASSDFQNTVRKTLLRGIALAIPYLIFVFILTTQVNGCIPDSNSSGVVAFCTDASTSKISIDGLSLFAVALLWSVLFGLLGASLKLANGQWRHLIFNFLHTTSRPRLVGMTTGALVATTLGCSLSLLLLYGLLAYNALSIPLLTQNLCLSQGGPIMVLWGFAQGPIHAVNLFFLSLGAPIIVNTSQDARCFYILNSTHATISLVGNPSQLPHWIYGIIILPFVSLFVGGRVSTSISKVQGIGPAIVQGAFIALPFAILMLLLIPISSITFIQSLNGSSNTTTPFFESASADGFQLFLWALLGGVVGGALGGLYQNSPLKTGVTSLLALLATPLQLFTKPIYRLFDYITRQNTSQRSIACGLLYGAVLCAFLLLLVAGVAGAILIANNSSLTFVDNQRIRDSVAVALILLPGLFLLCSCASALSTDPVLKK